MGDFIELYQNFFAQTPIRVKKFFNTSSTLSARKSEPSCSQYALSYLFLSSYFFITQHLPQIRLQWESIRVPSCSKDSRCSRRAYAGHRHRSHLVGSFRREVAVRSARSRRKWVRSSDGDLPFYLVICLSYLNGLLERAKLLAQREELAAWDKEAPEAATILNPNSRWVR